MNPNICEPPYSFSQSSEPTLSPSRPETQRRSPKVSFSGPEATSPRSSGLPFPQAASGNYQESFDPEYSSRFFGIPKLHNPIERYHGNYDVKYPRDAKGKEMAEDARVWRVYLDEADRYDGDMLRGFRDSIDSLLVFAALFSAVVTTFVVESCQSFYPDYTQATARMTEGMLLLQRAIASGNNTLVESILAQTSPTSSPEASYQTADLWINGLWFTSLSLALATSLASVLVKQWLSGYTSFPLGTTKDRVHIRHFRFMGLQHWKLPEIVGVLPILIQLSLAFFLVGLALFARSLNPILSWPVWVTAIVLYALHSTSTILSALYVHCPYRVPILYVPTQWVLYPWRILWRSVLNLTRKALRSPDRHPHVDLPTSFQESELAHYRFNNHLTAQSLLWLHSTSSDPIVRRIVVQAIAGSSPGVSWRFASLASPEIFQTAWNGLAASREEEPEHIELWERACYKLLTHADSRQVNHIFHLATLGGHITLMELLLGKGVDINADSFGNQHGANPLQLCAIQGRYDTIKWLIDHGADVRASSGAYGNALQSAAFYGHESIAQLLLENGADPNQRGGLYGSPLQAACAGGHIAVAALLLDYGADLNATTGGVYGGALHAACAKGHEHLVSYVLERMDQLPHLGPPGASLSLSLTSHPLCIAAQQGHQAVVSLLLPRVLESHEGEELLTAMVEVAEQHGHDNIVTLVEGLCLREYKVNQTV